MDLDGVDLQVGAEGEHGAVGGDFGVDERASEFGGGFDEDAEGEGAVDVD